MSVKVAIRVRPFNQRQKFLGCVSCVQMKDNTTIVFQNRGKQRKQHFFTFDYSFWSHDGFEQTQNGTLVPIDQNFVDQQKVYSLLGEQILQNAWVGFNCCLFAYGQTGAGKSYSMIGYGANKGIIPMACQQLFARVRRFERKGQRQYQVTISMLEIYNQKVQDLLINTNKRSLNGLKIRQNKTLGVYVEGLNKFPVTSYKQIEKKMQEGSKNRSLASTLMNEYSSRAHTIVMLEFIQKQWITEKKMSKKTSLINLVDLAGSQRVSKTGVGDNKDRLKQASLINKSLHTLGRCIQALAELAGGKKNIAVPYRDSALTRILENALGGNSKTTMICAISPANDNYEETLSTLRYADKTKKIKNKPVVNESEVDKLIRQLREENQRLKKMLDTPVQQSSMNSPSKGLGNADEILKNKQMKSNVRASMRQIQKQIKKNMQSFAINTSDPIEEDLLGQDSMMITDFVDLEDPSLLDEFETSFSNTNEGKNLHAYITNLNEDQMLNFKIKYSCEKNILVTNKDGHLSNDTKKKNILDFQQSNQDIKVVVLYGLGIQQNHARIIKDSKHSEKFYIEALSESSSDYTLLNGKPVTKRTQLFHNDRIILGINSVFLFKNNKNPVQRKNKKYTNQRSIGYQFALNQRQQQFQDESLLQGISSLANSGIRRKSSSSKISTKNSQTSNEDRQLKERLDQIQRQFAKMMQENERKVKQKQQKYKQNLLRLQRQKQQKQLEKQNLERSLQQKKGQTYKLRSKQLEIEKLHKKLEKFQKQKQKRKLYRQSLLLDGLGDDGKSNQSGQNDLLQNGTYSQQTQMQFQEVINATIKNNKQKFRPQIKNKKELPQSDRAEGKDSQDAQDILIQQYDDNTMDKDKTLLTTQANITNIMNSNSINLQTQQELDAEINYAQQAKERKPAKVKTVVQSTNTEGTLFIDEKAELQKYEKMVESYIQKIKNHMSMFTRLYDLTIKPSIKQVEQKIEQKTEQKVSEVIQIQPQKCEHCHRRFNTSNNDGSQRSEVSSPKLNHQKKPYPFQQKQIKFSKSNLSQLLASQSDKQRKDSSDDEFRQVRQKIKPQSVYNSDGLVDETMLLNTTQIIDSRNITSRRSCSDENIAITSMKVQNSQHINVENLNRKRVNSGAELSEIKEAEHEESRLIKRQNQDESNGKQKQLSSDIRDKTKSFPLINANQTNQEESEIEKSMLQLYIPHQDYVPQFEKQLHKSDILPLTQNKPQIPVSNQQQTQIVKPKPKVTSSQVQIQTQPNQQQPYDNERMSLPILSNEKKKKSSISVASSSRQRVQSSYGTVDFDLSMSDIEQGEHDLTVEQSLNFSSLNTFKEQELNQEIQELKEKIKFLEKDKIREKNQEEQMQRKKQSLLNQKNAINKALNQKKQQNAQQIDQTKQSKNKSVNIQNSQQEAIIQQNQTRFKKKTKKYSKKDQIVQEQLQQEQEGSSENDTPQFKKPKNSNDKKKKIVELPNDFSQKQFLKKRNKPEIDEALQKQLQNNLIQCNNENIINERNINLRKKKKEIQQLKKSLFKREKIELQKQLFVLIPMLERFNLIAKQMKRLIEGKIQVQYKNFSHFEIIEALKNFTKAKWSKRYDNLMNFSNVQIKIVIANLEDARIYKWPVQVFKNRFQIAQELFQKYIQNDTDQKSKNNQSEKVEQDRNKDPFWDPLDFISSGVGYLSLECLLYDLDYQGYISFVHNSKVIAKAYVSLSPVKKQTLKNNRSKQAQLEKLQAQKSMNVSGVQRPESSFQILNPRVYLQRSLYFTLTIESIEFASPDRESSSPPLKFQIQYQLLQDDYKNEIYTTQEVDFKEYGSQKMTNSYVSNKSSTTSNESHHGGYQHQINYMRRHSFKDINESTLAYISDCPIKFTLNLMKDYNQECLNSSFNQDLSIDDDQSSFQYQRQGTNDSGSEKQINFQLLKEQRSISNIDKIKSSISSNGSKSGEKLFATPSKSAISPLKKPSAEKPDFSKKSQKPIFYENSQMMDRMNKQCQVQQAKRKQKRDKLREKEIQLKQKKDKMNVRNQKQKQCVIF